MTWDSVLQLIALAILLGLVFRNGKRHDERLLDAIANIVARQDDRLRKKLSRIDKGAVLDEKPTSTTSGEPDEKTGLTKSESDAMVKTFLEDYYGGEKWR